MCITAREQHFWQTLQVNTSKSTLIYFLTISPEYISLFMSLKDKTAPASTHRTTNTRTHTRTHGPNPFRNRLLFQRIRHHGVENLTVAQYFPLLGTQNKPKRLRVKTIWYYDTAEKSHAGRGTCSPAGQYVKTGGKDTEGFTGCDEILVVHRQRDFCHQLSGARFHTIPTRNITPGSPPWHAGNASRN